MDPDEIESHLSRIETPWSMVFRAHQGESDSVEDARRALMERYGGAVRRYLLATTRDPEAAEDLAQEFALRFLRGDFRNADPGKGRFRSFVKRAVYHLMIDYHRRRQRRPGPLPDDLADPEHADPAVAEHNAQFLESWRAELMARAWEALAVDQRTTGRPMHDLLRLRVDHPDLRSPQIADRLSEAMGKSISPEWVRVNLHRARDRFVEHLVAEVAASLENPSQERLDDELEALGLLSYCRPALDRLRRQ